VAEFGLAMNRKFKGANGEDREEVCFVDCTAFGKPAEIINQYCQKGKLLYVEGRLKYDSWEDKNGGGKRSKLLVVVENFQFLGGRDAGGAGGGGSGGGYDAGAPADEGAPPQRAPARGPARPPQSRGPAQPPLDDSQQFKDDDIPF
jgi:single-strand DNA-binding protein